MKIVFTSVSFQWQPCMCQQSGKGLRCHEDFLFQITNSFDSNKRGLKEDICCAARFSANTNAGGREGRSSFQVGPRHSKFTQRPPEYTIHSTLQLHKTTLIPQVSVKKMQVFSGFTWQSKSPFSRLRTCNISVWNFFLEIIWLQTYCQVS
jgi:hypothetical protein